MSVLKSSGSSKHKSEGRKDETSVTSGAILSESKFFREGLKRLLAFQKAGLAFADQGTQLTAFFHEFSEALTCERSDPDIVSAQKALERLRDFNERIMELFNEANRKVLHHAIDPMQSLVDTQATQAKEARKKLEKAQVTYESKSKKRMSVIMSPAAKEEQESIRSTFERAEQETTEVLSRANTAASVHCLKLYSTFHKTFEHFFKAGSHVVNDMAAYHEEFRQLIAKQAEGAVGELSSSSDAFSLDGARKMVVSQLVEYEKRYMIQLAYVLSVKNKLDAIPDVDIASDIRDIFGNSEEIFSIHVEILTELEKGAVATDVAPYLAALFAKHKDNLQKHYEKYVRNYSLATSTLRHIRKVREVEGVLKECKHLQDVMTSMKLNDLLALPCRHIHRLKFLLQAVLDNTLASEKGWTELHDTIEQISEVIDRLEKAKTLSDRIAQLLRVKKMLVDCDEDIVDASRTFLHESDVTLLSFVFSRIPSPLPGSPAMPLLASSPSRLSLITPPKPIDLQPGSSYHLFLFNDVLVLAIKAAAAGAESSKEEAAEPAYKYLSRWPVQSLTIEEESASPAALVLPSADSDSRPPARNVFRVAHASGVFVFAVSTEAQRATWLARLRTAVASRRRTQVFGVEIEDILKHPSEKGRDVPSFFEDALSSLTSPSTILTEGIFRLSGNTLEMNRIQAALDAGEPVELREVHLTANLLKLWLRMLPTPLFTGPPIDEWTAAAEKQDRARLRDLVGRLPRYHRFVLASLIQALVLVSGNSEKNMMTVHNLAVVFAPTLLRGNGESSNNLVGTNRSCDVIEMLIEHFGEIFSAALVEQQAYKDAFRMQQAKKALEKIERRENLRKRQLDRELFQKGRARSSSTTDISHEATDALNLDLPMLAKRTSPPSPLATGDGIRIPTIPPPSLPKPKLQSQIQVQPPPSSPPRQATAADEPVKIASAESAFQSMPHLLKDTVASALVESSSGSAQQQRPGRKEHKSHSDRHAHTLREKGRHASSASDASSGVSSPDSATVVTPEQNSDKKHHNRRGTKDGPSPRAEAELEASPQTPLADLPCPECGSAVAQDSLSCCVGARRWHADHFVCSSCKKVLSQSAFIVEDDKLLCRACFH